MSSNKLLKSFTEGIFTDLKLTLVDDYQQSITINVHKIILYIKCTFFEKLLLFNDGNITEKTINVPNVYVCRDIIESFYLVDNKSEVDKSQTNQDPMYQFQLYICRDFLGLLQDKNALFNLDIPINMLDDFFNFAELYSNNNNMIRLIFRNIPKNYDFELIPKNLLLAMKKYVSESRMYILDDEYKLIQYDLCPENLSSKIITHRIFNRKYNSEKYIYALGENDFAIVKNNTIEIYDYQNEELINQIQIGQLLINDIKDIEYCETNLLIVTGYTLLLINSDNGKILKHKKFDEHIKYVTFTINCIYVNFKKRIKVLNYETMDLIKDIECDNRHDYVGGKIIYDLSENDLSGCIIVEDVLSDKIISFNHPTGIIKRIYGLDVDFRFEKYVVVDWSDIIKIFDVKHGTLLSEYNIGKISEKYQLNNVTVLYAKFLHDTRYIIIKMNFGNYFVLDTLKQELMTISSKSLNEYRTHYKISSYCQYLPEINSALLNQID
ncbi:putative BTB/POZ domain-containing protein [Acanthamoeba castellanii mimivirus]|uniref:Putative BTB/POZ domain-containing protein L35 n=6 Tax=Mimivirus TaxID=315393 RepID=YL035_MIMIV|nr:putative BTB/POZ domain-containing protein [Acanthamoeba polyphaga mimivirus]Q5UPB5.1 RecName: Full=Putative BTB/POZ domain-containing protein L35 [Acanthamoeba polyphaga mimivirus]AHA45853.1 putative BTB/POZ domain-containing protein [Hirudovirus strain Sangsue]AMK61720.1 BTB/POZ domain-containing protein [Samba virus]AMZ02486.1 putative BTB/POZ domain-containing protein [Mimivirus Bombay]BAV61110.1 putative BTB/POZ domain-containing protein [Acanthamoeba castellanii mimivirus]AAV50310.1 